MLYKLARIQQLHKEASNLRFGRKIFQPSITKVGMESSGTEATRKRMKPDEKEGDEADSRVVEKEEFETTITGFEEMELNISRMLEKIQQFTQMVSEFLEAGKTLFKELSDQFEEQLIMVHKEQIEKWQEEIKDLRSLDSSNEEANALLHNARYLFQQTRID